MKNPSQAFYYLSLAAVAGYAVAMCSVAICYQNGIGVAADKEKALMWYKSAGWPQMTLEKAPRSQC